MSMDVDYTIIQRNYRLMRENDLHFFIKLYIDRAVYDIYSARFIPHPAQTVMIFPDQDNFSMQCFG